MGPQVVKDLVTMIQTRITAVLALLMFAVAVMPTGSAQEQQIGIQNPYVSTPTLMYFHFDGRQDFPINTQVPAEQFEMAQGSGIVTHSLECLPGEGAVPTLVRNTHHTEYGYSSPGYVEYDFEDSDGKPRYHKERGISFDVDLDLQVAPVITWFVETQVTNAQTNGPSPNSAPIVVPQVVVEVTVREGDDVSVDHEALNAGQVIANGASDPADLAGSATQDHPHASYVGTSNRGFPLYKFEFPLEYETSKAKSTILADESYNVRIDMYVAEPTGACTGPDHPASSTIMPDLVKVYSGPGARPTLGWNVMNPIVIDYLHPQFIGDDLVVHTASNSPWGNYDVAEVAGAYGTPGGMEISIEGPSIPVSLEQVAFVQRFHDHDHHTEAVDATWLWEYKKDRAKEGDYFVTLKVKNDQENAQAVGTVAFNVGDGTVQGCGDSSAKLDNDCFTDVQKDGARVQVESPGVGFLALIGALGAALVTLRRRS